MTHPHCLDGLRCRQQWTCASWRQEAAAHVLASGAILGLAGLAWWLTQTSGGMTWLRVLLGLLVVVIALSVLIGVWHGFWDATRQPGDHD